MTDGYGRASSLEPDRKTREDWLRVLARFLQDHIDALAYSPASGAQGEAARTILFAGASAVLATPATQR